MRETQFQGTSRKRQVERGAGLRTEPMPSVGGGAKGGGGGATAPLPSQAWPLEKESQLQQDAQMRDAVEGSPSAKRAATEPLRDDGEVTMKELVQMLNSRFNQVLAGQDAQAGRASGDVAGPDRAVVRRALHPRRPARTRGPGTVAEPCRLRSTASQPTCGRSTPSFGVGGRLFGVCVCLVYWTIRVNTGIGAANSGDRIQAARHPRTPEEEALDICRRWLDAVRFTFLVTAEIICPYRLTSVLNARFRSSSEAPDTLELLRPLAKPFMETGRELNMCERSARNGMLLQKAEALRDAARTQELRHMHSKRPYDVVCWRSASVLLCRRKRAHFDENRSSRGAGGTGRSSRAPRRSWRRGSSSWLVRGTAGFFATQVVPAGGSRGIHDDYDVVSAISRVRCWTSIALQEVVREAEPVIRCLQDGRMLYVRGAAEGS